VTAHEVDAGEVNVLALMFAAKMFESLPVSNRIRLPEISRAPRSPILFHRSVSAKAS